MAGCCYEADVGKHRLSWLSSLLADFELVFVASVAIFARTSFYLSSQSPGSAGKGTTKKPQNRRLFTKHTKKNHATLATAATTTTESPPSHP